MIDSMQVWVCYLVEARWPERTVLLMVDGVSVTVTLELDVKDDVGEPSLKEVAVGGLSGTVVAGTAIDGGNASGNEVEAADKVLNAWCIGACSGTHRNGQRTYGRVGFAKKGGGGPNYDAVVVSGSGKRRTVKEPEFALAT